jgi:hypothetical protein
MTYPQAVLMQQEMIAALKFRALLPDEYKEVANKYSAEQWMECRKALLERLNAEKELVTDMVKFVIQVRRGGGGGGRHYEDSGNNITLCTNGGK